MPKRIRNYYGIGLIIVCYLSFSPKLLFAQQTVQQPLLSRVRTPENPKVIITHVAGERVNAANKVTIETLDGVEGEDIQVQAWALPEDAQIWIVVNPSQTRHWSAYGPATEESDGIWTVHGVRLGEAFPQGRYFRLRAVVTREQLKSGEMLAESWRNGAVATSLPMIVTVSQRVVLGSDTQGIQILTVNNNTVDPLRPTLNLLQPEDPVIPPSANISGTLRLGTLHLQNANASQSSNAANQSPPPIYVIVHTPGTDKWRISRCAESSVIEPEVRVGQAQRQDIVFRWEVRDLLVVDPGEPYQSNFDLLAIATSREIRTGWVSYETWRKYAIVVSASVSIVSHPIQPAARQVIPAIKIEKVKNRNDGDISDTAKIEEIAIVEGTIEPLLRGSSIWILINPAGSQMWVIHGPALLAQSESIRPNSHDRLNAPIRWVLPIMRFEALGNEKTSHLRMMAIVTTSILMPGLADYNTWRSKAISASEIKTIKTGNPIKQNGPSMIELSVSKVAGVAVRPNSNEYVPNSGDIEGEVSGASSHSFLWAAVHEKGTQGWMIKGPALITENKWIIPGVVFSEDKEGNEAKTYKDFEITAFVTDFTVGIDQIDLAELPFYARAISPIVRVVDAPADSIGKEFRSMNWPWIIIISLVLLLLALLERLFRLVSNMAAYLAETFESSITYIRERFPWLNEKYETKDILGLIIMAIGLFAIFNYFPLYSHVISSLFNLPIKVSNGLAIVLITFIGLAGVLLDLTNRYVGMPNSTSGQTPTSSQTRGLLHTFAVALMFLVTLVLWAFQTILYFGFYANTGADPLVSLALGGAALFIAIVETLGFYWASRLGLGVIAWVVISVFLLGPFYILAKVFRLLELLFGSLSSKSKAAVNNWAIKLGMDVFCEDGKIGSVESVIMDPARRNPNALIVSLSETDLTGSRLKVLINWVARVELDRIVLPMTKSQLLARAEYIL
jgi:hypothetical protein